MLLTCNSIASVFYIALLLAILPSSYAYTYSCNASAACGCSLNPASVTRIVGGELAGTSTWSWAVSISIGGVSLCGGAILSSSWIISAAHCFIKSIGSTVTIYAGSDIRFRGQSRIASRVIIHPDYLGSTQVNDIALIELSTPLTMTDTVKTICIPSVSSSSLVSGEWPAANLYVCYHIALLLLLTIHNCYLIGCRCRLGHFIRKWFAAIIAAASHSSNRCL